MMRFENEMIAPIKRRLAERWKDGLLFEEFGVGYGVADVVAVRPSRPGIARRRRLGQFTALPRRAEVQVLRALQQVEEASFEDLLAVTGISPKRLRYETLRFLLHENYIEEVRRGLYRRRGRHRPVAREIWAVEAKMKNWFEGLCQARRYQHFAHRVYLAIAGRHLDRVDDAVLREHNVGLIAVSRGGADIVFHPRRQEPHNEELFLVSNERIWEQMHPA
jgi:predicted transcriptional regulator